MSTQPRPAPYGSWKSPITSALIVRQSVGLAEARFDGDDLYWLESRPQERGRYVVVRGSGGGAGPQDVTPAYREGQPNHNVRTGAHGYGGGAWAVAAGVLYFSSYTDGRLYRQDGIGVDPVPLTAPPSTVAGRDLQWKYADGVIDRARRRWVGVCEDHSDPDRKYPDNRIVAVALDGAGPGAGNVLAEGHDFFSSPRLSPDGRSLAWLAWDHPNMPWIGTTLYVAALDAAGRLTGEPRVIAGGAAESLFQPEWAPDSSVLYFVSDRTGWWNLYVYDMRSQAIRPLAPLQAEFGLPQWSFGMSTYALAGGNRIVAAYVESGLGRLALIDAADGGFTDLTSRFDLPYTHLAWVQADGADRVVFRAGASDIPGSIVLLHLNSGRTEVLKKSIDAADDPNLSRYFSKARPIEFPTENGKAAYGLYYPPANPDYTAPAGEKPPLIVKCHGGPTSAASTVLDLKIQYWTSRGIAVLDVNYGGSSGYGRAYRDRLRLQWGVVDVDDCVNGAKHVAAQGDADERRSVMSGGSSGGYTTLAALTFREYFQGGASYYGISDISALAQETHKFEMHYLDWLIGPYPQEEARYRDRSPVFHAQRLSKPVIFFQGDQDKVVPPDQTDKMVEALRRRGTPVGYLLFAGEEHGFRISDNIQRALDAELYFYSFEVFQTGLSY